MKNFVLGCMALTSLACILWIVFWAQPSLPNIGDIPSVPDSARPLAERRVQLLKLIEKNLQARVSQGLVSTSSVSEARLTRLEAELELATTKEARIELLEKQITAAKQLEATARKLHQRGFSSADDVMKAELFRLEIQIDLERQKARTR